MNFYLRKEYIHEILEKFKIENHK